MQETNGLCRFLGGICPNNRICFTPELKSIEKCWSQLQNQNPIPQIQMYFLMEIWSFGQSFSIGDQHGKSTVKLSPVPSQFEFYDLVYLLDKDKDNDKTLHLKNNHGLWISGVSFRLPYRPHYFVVYLQRWWPTDISCFTNSINSLSHRYPINSVYRYESIPFYAIKLN